MCALGVLAVVRHCGIGVLRCARAEWRACVRVLLLEQGLWVYSSGCVVSRWAVRMSVAVKTQTRRLICSELRCVLRRVWRSGEVL